MLEKIALIGFFINFIWVTIVFLKEDEYRLGWFSSSVGWAMATICQVQIVFHLYK